jgi:hypothetical protein
LAPGWPEEVVADLSTPLNIDVLARAVDERVLDRMPATSPWERPIYRMSASFRDAAIEQLTEQAANEQSSKVADAVAGLREELVRAADVMARADKLQYDPILLRWTQVAAHAKSDEELGRFLDKRVTEALDAARHTGSLAAPEALRWIEAVEPFAQLFKGTLEAAITMARGKRELFYRRGDDERRLLHYYPPPEERDRPASERAFDELLHDQEHWALHYVGGGGLGKTTLVRYIANRLAPSAGAAVARIDFDLLNPDYPLREPGMLLARFAEDLRLQTGTELGAFAAFDAALESLNDWIAHERSDGRNGRVTVDHPLFRRVIDGFARACLKLQRRIFLILDTCEELAKLRPDGSQPDNVKVTFDVLTALRATDTMKEQLRIVFSGRRALASEGHGWTAPSSSLPPRPFLRLFRVTGFSEAEARAFLTRYMEADRPVPADLHDDILRLSRTGVEDDDTARFLPPLADAAVRYNPYDIDMYARWAASAPKQEPLTAEQLQRAGPHFYIEERIAKRVAPDVWKLVPALALLGRFDRKLLEELVAFSHRGPELLQEAIDQEWVRPDRSAARDKWLIDAALQERLERYFTEVRPAELDAGRRLLAGVLPRVTLKRPFNELAERYFAATFEALRDQPERAAEWWLQVEHRILDAGAWDWALSLIATLLAHPVMSPRLRASFRPVVLALRASALLHAGGTISAATWQEIRETIHAYPAAYGRARLRYRLDCALKCLEGNPDLAMPPQEDDSFYTGGGAPGRQYWGTLAAAAEAAVEQSEIVGGLTGRSYNVLSQAIERLIESPDVYVKAFGTMLRARLGEQGKALTGVVDDFSGAARLALQATPSRWFDWIGPDDLYARVMLEAIRALNVEPPVSGASRSAASTIDSDRFRAAHLRMLDGHNAQLNVSAGTSPLAKPRCRAHRETPPYDVVANEIIGRDRPGEAIARLKDIAARATSAGLAEVAIEADRAAARSIRRHRLLSEGFALPESVISSRDPKDVRLRVVTRALHLSAERAARAVADLENPRPARSEARRANAVALFEWAELAYLKGDAAAQRTCAEAESLFQDTGDTSGRTRARIARAAWLATRGEYGKLQAMLTEAPLPVPGGLTQNSVTALIETRDQDWRPWAVRAIAASLAAAGESGSTQRQTLATWIADHYTTDIEGEKHLPCEIATAEPPQWRVRLQRLLTGIGFTFAVAFGVAMIAGLFYGSWRLVAPVAGDWPWPLHALAATITLFGGSWLLTQGAPRLGQELLARLTRVTCSVKLSRNPEDPNRPLTVDWELITQARVLSVEFADSHTMNPATLEEGYRDLAKSIGIAERADVGLRFLRGLGRLLDLRIVMDPMAEAAPWEAVIAFATMESPRLSWRGYGYRRLTAYRQSPQPDWQGQVVVTTCRSSAANIAGGAEGWVTTSAGNRIEFEILSRRQYDEERPQTGVVHIIGTPVERRGHPYLQIGGLDATEDPYLVATNDLIQRYPNVRLLILQAVPTEVPVRTSTDRLEAAYMKRLGGIAFQSGVPAVLVVPAIPAAFAREVTTIMYDVLRQGQRNAARRLIFAHRRIQARIADGLPQLGHDSVEIMFDTCLYIDDRVNFHVRQ